MERQKKVVDTSVIVKCFLQEDKTDKAVTLIENHLMNNIEIVVPELFFLEVLNTLRYKEKDENKLNETIKILLNAKFLIVPLNQFILERSLEISLQYDLSIYDALYAALSQIHGCSLVTEDKKLKKFPSAVAL
ncbi:type II toxin-antitoxin system VapC family toxin [Candidatus Pacearchaeota archaeon]|nr:type II toxin-antitoxin system VapC family toxin [Candidatus Pacearchaeota archaeon]